MPVPTAVEPSFLIVSLSILKAAIKPMGSRLLLQLQINLDLAEVVAGEEEWAHPGCPLLKKLLLSRKP